MASRRVLSTLSMKRTVLAVLFIAALAPAALARVRAVHRPASHSCTFSVAPTWSGSIAAGGVTRATVLVFGQTGACATWAAYSSASWAIVEAAPLDAQPAAYVTLAPNDTLTARTANLIIAGIRLQVTQEGAARISPPTVQNLIVNGTFDTKNTIAPWGWLSGFPNGFGVAEWSQFDASGNPASGSILLRDTGDFNGLQRLQCVPVEKSTRYVYGAKVRAGAGSDRGLAELAVFLTPSTTCTDVMKDYTFDARSILQVSSPGEWQEFTFSLTTGSRSQALLFVISSSATVHPFEIWFDDIFVRKE